MTAHRRTVGRGPTTMLPYVCDGPMALVPPRAAALLEHYAKLDELRLAVRGRDPEFASVLYAIHVVGLQYDPAASVEGSPRPHRAEPPTTSELMTAAQVAE